MAAYAEMIGNNSVFRVTYIRERELVVIPFFDSRQCRLELSRILEKAIVVCGASRFCVERLHVFGDEPQATEMLASAAHEVVDSYGWACAMHDENEFVAVNGAPHDDHWDIAIARSLITKIVSEPVIRELRQTFGATCQQCASPAREWLEWVGSYYEHHSATA